MPGAPRRPGRGKGGPTNFRELSDAQLAKLSDEELIAYIVHARAAGRAEAAVVGVQVLAYRHERRVIGFIYNQLGSKGADVVDEVAARTIADAIRSAASFEGGTIQEFRAWIFRIARRRRIDYLRKNRVEEVPLAWEYGEEGEEREIVAGDPYADFDEMSVQKQVFNAALAELKAPHKLVILLAVFHELPHKQIAEQVNRQFGEVLDDPMTENNVSQILSRFRKRLDGLLEEADDPPPPPDDDD